MRCQPRWGDWVRAAGCVVALAAVVLAQISGVLIEQLRLRNEHISFRAFELPASRHGWRFWAIATALFAGIAALELLREVAPAGRRNRARD